MRQKIAMNQFELNMVHHSIDWLGTLFWLNLLPLDINSNGLNLACFGDGFHFTFWSNLSCDYTLHLSCLILLCVNKFDSIKSDQWLTSAPINCLLFKLFVQFKFDDISAECWCCGHCPFIVVHCELDIWFNRSSDLSNKISDIEGLHQFFEVLWWNQFPIGNKVRNFCVSP